MINFSAVRPIKKLEANYDTPSFASTRPLALLWSTTTSAVPTFCPLSPFWGFLPDTLMIKIKMQLKFGRVCLEGSTAQFLYSSLMNRLGKRYFSWSHRELIFWRMAWMLPAVMAPMMMRPTRMDTQTLAPLMPKA